VVVSRLHSLGGSSVLAGGLCCPSADVFVHFMRRVNTEKTKDAMTSIFVCHVLTLMLLSVMQVFMLNSSLYDLLNI